MLATGLLAWLPGHYRTIFLIAALPGAGAVWLTFRLREAATTPNEATPATPPCPAPSGKPWSGLPRSFWLTLGLLLGFALANSSDTLLILRAKNLGLSDVQTILAYTLFNVVYAGSAYPLGALSDRCGRWRLVIGGWLLYAAVYIGFALADGEAIWWLFPFYGLFMGLTDGTGRALIRDYIPEEKREPPWGSSICPSDWPCWWAISPPAGAGTASGRAPRFSWVACLLFLRLSPPALLRTIPDGLREGLIATAVNPRGLPMVTGIPPHGRARRHSWGVRVKGRGTGRAQENLRRRCRPPDRGQASWPNISWAACQSSSKSTSMQRCREMSRG